jgi:hypothetical protein
MLYRDVIIKLTEPFFSDLAALLAAVEFKPDTVEPEPTSNAFLIDTPAIRNGRKSLKIKGGNPF